MSAFIEVNKAQVDDVVALLGGIEKDAKIALRRSINNTATGAKTAIAKDIVSKVTLRSKKIKEYITVTKATNNKLSAVVKLRGAFIPLAAFKTTPTLANSQLDYGNGVSVKVWKDKRAIRFRHAFFAIMPTGHAGLFLRDPTNSRNHSKSNPRRESRSNAWGSTELAISEMFGPPITTVYEKTPGLSNQVETTAAERLLRETESQVNYILSKR